MTLTEFLSYEFLESALNISDINQGQSRPLHDLIEINYDAHGESLFIKDSIRRIDITSSKDALNGYQKGKCFYCSREIKIQNGFTK